MSTELWIRNPALCIKECLEENVKNIVFDIGLLKKRNIDPETFMKVYYPASMDWRVLVIGTPQQGAVEIRPGYTYHKPYKEHVVWEFGQELALLEMAMAEPQPGEMIVITGVGISSSGPARKFLTTLQSLQEDYPEAWIHYHGSYSFRTMFGLNHNSADYDPRYLAHKGKVVIPVGKEMTYEKAAESPEWVYACGMRPVDLKIPRNRCMYNIRSAVWASKFFKRDVKFYHKRMARSIIDPDAYSILESYKTAPTRVFFQNNLDKQPGDLFLCDVCSVQLSCRYFRTGSVCAVPDSEPADLAKFFKSRDSDVIIEGLGTLLAAQTRRLERAIVEEETAERVSPEVTKMINTLFDRGVKLAKLVDPALAAAGSTKINLRFQQNHAAIQTATPQALMAGVVAELEARGIPRSKITPEMIEMLLTEKKQELLKENITDAVIVESES